VKRIWKRLMEALSKVTITLASKVLENIKKIEEISSFEEFGN
jgi:hypothetical protein